MATVITLVIAFASVNFGMELVSMRDWHTAFERTYFQAGAVVITFICMRKAA